MVLSVAALALSSTPARADRGRDPLAGQPAIRHKVELRKMRFEITPQFLVSMNQPFLIGVGGGANLQFHFTDWLGLGASFHYTGSVASPLAGQVQGALYDPVNPQGKTAPPAALLQPTVEQFQAHLVGPNLLGSLYLTLTPIGGKFALFNSLFANYDFYGLLGGGFVNLTTPLTPGDCQATYSGTGTPTAQQCLYSTPNNMATGNNVNFQQPTPFTGLRAAGVVGIGVHFFFNNWLALQLEVRDYFYKSNPGGLDVNPTDQAQGNPPVTDGSPVLTSADEYIVNMLYFGAGLTFMLPTTVSISR